MYVFHVGVNTAEELACMLVRSRYRFECKAVEGDPRRYITVYTAEAEAAVKALLEVL